MKFKLKESGDVKLTLAPEEFEALARVMCYVRLGSDNVLSKLALQMLDRAEFMELDLDTDEVDFTVEVSKNLHTRDYDVSVIIEG